MKDHDNIDWGEKMCSVKFVKLLWLHKGPIMEGPGISDRLPFLTVGHIVGILHCHSIHGFSNGEGNMMLAGV